MSGESLASNTPGTTPSRESLDQEARELLAAGGLPLLVKALHVRVDHCLLLLEVTSVAAEATPSVEHTT